jgi:hypothetical protein
MATPITAAQRKQIQQLTAKGLSSRAIGRELGLHDTTVLRYRSAPATDPQEPADFEGELRRLLKRGPASAKELAGGLGCGTAEVKRRIAEMQGRGALLLNLPGGLYDLGSTQLIAAGHAVFAGAKSGVTSRRFGITTDNHLCNKHSRLDVLNAAYDHFERRGITTVFNAGNWVDGEARFNKSELITAPGMDNQLDYMIDKWPVRKGITTHYIAGDDHEGWYSQREGIEVGKYLQMRAEDQGRHDLKYLGYGECDVELQCAKGSAVMRVVHPGGGSSYAISYTDQKRAESYQGGEKPQVEIVGHYHKFNHGFPREIHAVQCGCTCDQTMFMRKKRLQAHVGFVEVEIDQDAAGIITRFNVQWFPFFNRGFYEKRFK